MDAALWEQVKQQHSLGAEVTGIVTEIRPYGVFLDLGVGLLGLMLVPEAGLERGEQAADHFHKGESVTARVLWHNDERQILSLTRR